MTGLFRPLLGLVGAMAAEHLTSAFNPLIPALKRFFFAFLLFAMSAVIWSAALILAIASLFFHLAGHSNWSMPALWSAGGSAVAALALDAAGFLLLRPRSAHRSGARR